MTVKHTPEEIVARIRKVQTADFFGVQMGDLVVYLTYDLAREFLRDGVSEAEFNVAASSALAPLEAAKDYLPFAWDKANNCRGLSAGRSLHHLSAWLWLAGFGDFVDEEFGSYKALLVMASTICGFAWREHDNGCWTNGEDEPGLPGEEVAEIVAAAEAKARAAIAASGGAV